MDAGRSPALLAGRVAAQAHLADLRAVRVEFQLVNPEAAEPFDLDGAPVVAWARDVGLASYLITLELTAQSRSDADDKLFTASLQFVVNYTLPEDFEFTDDECEAFGIVGANYAAYPYIREMLHSLTGKAGVPPLLLDVLRLPLIHADETQPADNTDKDVKPRPELPEA